MVMKLEPKVGTRLRILREQQALSLRELAERIDLSFNTISRIERGDISPPVSTLKQLATALKVRTSAFFDDGFKIAVTRLSAF
jgi:transcriptional regulator with XRE-family HTH domain